MTAEMLYNYDRCLLEVRKTPALIVHGFDHWNVQKRITELALQANCWKRCCSLFKKPK